MDWKLAIACVLFLAALFIYARSCSRQRAVGFSDPNGAVDVQPTAPPSTPHNRA